MAKYYMCISILPSHHYFQEHMKQQNTPSQTFQSFTYTVHSAHAYYDRQIK